jgi:hypothetical protein
VLEITLGSNAKMTTRLFDLAIHLETDKVEAEEIVRAYRKLARQDRKYRLTPCRFHQVKMGGLEALDVERETFNERIESA